MTYQMTTVTVTALKAMGRMLVHIHIGRPDPFCFRNHRHIDQNAVGDRWTEGTVVVLREVVQIGCGASPQNDPPWGETEEATTPLHRRGAAANGSGHHFGSTKAANE